MSNNSDKFVICTAKLITNINRNVFVLKAVLTIGNFWQKHINYSLEPNTEMACSVVRNIPMKAIRMVYLESPMEPIPSVWSVQNHLRKQKEKQKAERKPYLNLRQRPLCWRITIIIGVSISKDWLLRIPQLIQIQPLRSAIIKKPHLLSWMVIPNYVWQKMSPAFSSFYAYFDFLF